MDKLAKLFSGAERENAGGSIAGWLADKLPAIVPAVILLASLVLKWSYAPIIYSKGEWTDYVRFLKPWVDFYRANGIVGGLGKGVGNYFVPYNVFLACISKLHVEPYYPIMLLSVAFDFAMVFAVYKVMRHLAGCGEKALAVPGRYILAVASSVAALPVVVANSGIWKQCDSVWTAFLLLALYFFCRERYRWMFVCTGIAFCVKLQAVFFLPFLVMAYVAKRDIPLRGFLWIPAAVLAGGLPAVLCGRPVLETYSVYAGQVGLHKEMCVNSPGIYAIGMMDYELYRGMALLLIMMVFAFALVFVNEHRENMGPAKWIYLCGWCLMTCFEFLPAMHERYDYPAIVLLTACAMFFRRQIAVPVLAMHLVSACTYAHCLWRYSPDYTVLALFYLAAWVWITRDLAAWLADKGSGPVCTGNAPAAGKKGKGEGSF